MFKVMWKAGTTNVNIYNIIQHNRKFLFFEEIRPKNSAYKEQTIAVNLANYSINSRDSERNKPKVPNPIAPQTAFQEHPPVNLFDNTKVKIPVSITKVLNTGISYLEQISHLDEVRNAQSKVMVLKDKLKESGDQKRRILNELNHIREDIQRNHNEIASAMRGTERYVILVKEEMNLLNKENKKQIEFSSADDIERQLFNSLTTAINDSHEKEKIHTNFIKILGLIGTLTASIITLIVSAIGHFYHNTKFGLVAKDFKESVNHTLISEIGNLKDSIKLEIQTASQKQEKILRQQFDKINEQQQPQSKVEETWTGFFYRYGKNIFYYIFPKGNT